MEPHSLPVVAHLATLAREHGLKRISVALGVFDGVHRGHQLILSALCDTARKTASTPVAVTFTPHPRSVLTPDDAPSLLTRDSQRVELLARYGAGAVVLLPFDRTLAELPPNAFLRKHLFTETLEICSICVGQDWRFGRRGSGNVELLGREATKRGTTVISMPPFTLYGKPVSSTRIREAVTAGKLGLAGRLLGRPYAIAGTVVHGKGIGRKACRCATANVDASGMVLPPSGVYAVAARIEASPDTPRPAIAYIGSAPTIRTDPDTTNAQRSWVETHLFDHNDDLYGQRVEVEFVAFLRGDRAFPSVTELRQQIDRDIADARAVAARR